MTSFARMNRSDHSMLPPASAATLAFGSPNACSGCHTDKDASWADKLVREWRPRDYQAPLLHRASLVDAARKRDWSRREAMLQYVTSPDRDEVFAASLIRLIPPSTDPSVTRMLRKAAEDPSPLVRSAVMEALAMLPSQSSLEVLVKATGDESRLVRVRAVAALSAYPDLKIVGEEGRLIRRAEEEYMTSLLAWPDQWSSHYNLGNHHLNRGALEEAVGSYDRALTFEPRAAMVLVNRALALAGMGESGEAERSLSQALRVAPDNAAARFNLGLLKAEHDEPGQAEESLKAALSLDPQMAQAAYKLCVLLVRDRLREAVGFCREAVRLRPEDARYAYTLAFTLNQKGETAEAMGILKIVVEKFPEYRDARTLLGRIGAEDRKP
jgi:Flp pilus assembly protein TadD